MDERTHLSIGRGATTAPEVEFHSMKVGERHPYLEPPPAGGQMLDLATGFPTFNCFLSPPVDAEVASLAGTCVAYGLYPAPECGGAVPTFVFQGTHPGAWAIYAPTMATPEEARDWVMSDTNIVHFHLMEAGTGIVRQLRHIGVGGDYLAEWKKLVRKARHPAGAEAFARIMGQIGEKGLWERSRKWIWQPEAGQFRRR